MPVIDTHLHLFDPAAHVFNAEAPYRPQPHECATWPALRDLLEAHGVQAGVLVAPTAGYNHDLRPLTDTLALAAPRLRGVARLRGYENDAVLDALEHAGIVGVRLDLRHDGSGEVRRMQDSQAVSRWARRGWFVQVQAQAQTWNDVADELSAWPVELVIDHCGWPDTSVGCRQPGFRAVCALAERPRTWAKLSGAFRFSQSAWPHDDVVPFVRQLVDRFGAQRCIWGSDWPFVRVPQRLDYGAVLGLLARWVPDAEERHAILDDSPKRLLRLKQP